MPTAEDLALVKQHAPVLWLHEDERFPPVDAQVAVDLATLYRNGNPVPQSDQPKTLDDLGGLKHSKQCELRLPGIDLSDFQVADQYKPRTWRQGPEAMREIARAEYGVDLAAAGAGTKMPKYYARVSTVDVRQRQRDPVTQAYRLHDPDFFGRYTLIEYFFYFAFNDSWNLHEGDWDAMVHLYVKDDRTYMVNHLHTVRWVSRWNEPSPDLASWLAHWNNLGKREVGDAYVIGGHPYVFLAQGAHGGYPTPGFSLHGVDFPGIISRDLLADTDERQIGKTCIVPDRATQDLVRTNLDANGVDTSGLRFTTWLEPELVDRQAWLDYEGGWGQDAPYAGWSGPRQPPISKGPNKNSLRDSILHGYTSGSVLANWHGIA